jgi:hypothetical protein
LLWTYCQSDNDKQFWDTSDAGGTAVDADADSEAGPSNIGKAKQEFDYTELEASTTEESVAGQKVRLVTFFS